ncbi:hypothetical protein [Streptomyces ipomoeae]|uniref:hypothetical protein n=1 Tax=Streptomyces ipomoeae TaxID=103232 RepID=UPI0011467C81|nr:hypothetical protein [Streptomyces ipomoeae]MDX2939038.1 hypothetical protein [Streptomyces ipomoeae]TQE25147.1 hypothetical protein SipoB123_16945 [Streptomyces ipomoeae]
MNRVGHESEDAEHAGAERAAEHADAARVEHAGAENDSRVKRLSRVTRMATLVGTAAAVTAAAVCATVLVRHEVTNDPSRPEAAGAATNPGGVIIAHGSDRHPSQTAADWVTYADHVVAVTPVSEREISPTAEELENGEGLILRDVTLRVDDVLWSSDTPGKPAPTSFEWVAHGWQFTEGDTANRTEMAGEHQPRIELGHSYVMAIEWQPPVCAEEDEIPGQWRGLGSDSNIPFDGKVLGRGESEGTATTTARALSAAKAETDPDDPNYSLEDQLIGKSATALTEALQKAEPTETGASTTASTAKKGAAAQSSEATVTCE